MDNNHRDLKNPEFLEVFHYCRKPANGESSNQRYFAIRDRIGWWLRNKNFETTDFWEEIG